MQEFIFCFSFCYLRFSHTCFVLFWHRMYFGLHSVHLIEDTFAAEILCPGFSIFRTLLITRLEFEERRGFGNAERMWGLAK